MSCSEYAVIEIAWINNLYPLSLIALQKGSAALIFSFLKITRIPSIKVDEASPMVFPFDVTTTFLREDVPTTPLSNEDALKNASDVIEGQIRLPKVVG